MASKASPKKPAEMQREVVTVGLDLSPIQLDTGDGNVWEFNSDPSPAEFGALQDTLSEFSQMGKQDPEEANIAETIQRLSDAMRALLVREDQRREWDKVSYGIMAVQNIAMVYIPAMTGVPTK